ncbi:putative ATPase [Actimicrobium sp. GrIS 1.19]|uniref:AAA family ATPase n=1 Tax=Actimicrobium sp. GrIS 1.19 TaxID=3071708 RepID=UPI002DFDFDE6|nr:putative ATPase [Actimicrobium sp. GrIS 1.19]
MEISNIKIKNWRNFQDVDVKLASRTFIVGANASGKSNFLDVFRFLRDVSSSSGGGLQKALKDRGGLAKIRSLAARKFNNIYFEVDLVDSDEVTWKYVLEITQETAGKRRPIVKREEVYRSDVVGVLVTRPDSLDKADPERLTQTNLEQVNSNGKFREVVDFFASVIYLHLGNR